MWNGLSAAPLPPARALWPGKGSADPRLLRVTSRARPHSHPPLGSKGEKGGVPGALLVRPQGPACVWKILPGRWISALSSCTCCSHSSSRGPILSPPCPLPAPGQPDGFRLLQLRSNSGSQLNHTPPSQPLPAPDPSGSLAAAWPTSDTSVSSKYLRNECVVASSRGGRESPARTPHGAGLPRTTQNVG